MLPYQNKNLPIEDRISDLISRMTLKEKIRQTDQYFCMDFTTCDENGFADSLDMEKVDKALGGLSCGSIQIRGMSAEQANEIQKYAVEKTRLGIPFLLSEEALHGVHRGDATSFLSSWVLPPRSARSSAIKWAVPSPRKPAPWAFMKPTVP